MSSEHETITVADQGGGLTVVTLNRPTVANAMNTQMGRDLLAFFDGVNADPLQRRCMVLTGAGDKAFCAGGDLKERQGMSDETWQAQHLLFERMIRAFIACPVPVIGAINGAAYAGGCELALCCDFIYASENARFGLPEVSLGVIPGFGGTQRLTRLVGRARAKELIFTGDLIDAAKAKQIGLVMDVVPLANLLGHARSALERVAKKGPLAVRRAKEAIDRGADLELADGLTIESKMFSDLFDSSDRREGMKAFLEKRPPVFTGR
jgi:enoyl-CoA hydratase